MVKIFLISGISKNAILGMPFLNDHHSAINFGRSVMQVSAKLSLGMVDRVEGEPPVVSSINQTTEAL